jgi:DNA-binding response OmpR family regulator
MATTRSFSESHSTSKREAGQDRVLLVEDQDDHAALIEIQLSAHDGGRWTVERVATLRDAVAAAAAWRPDVVVLDLNLPDSRGLATVNAFCHAHPDLPVVVATVEADETIGV